MKNLYLFLVVSFTFCFSNAQIVNIPDVAFKRILLDNNCVDTNGDYSGDASIDLNGDGEIQVNEALAVINLVIPTNEYTNTSTNEVSYIADITGLEAFSNVQILTIDTSLNNNPSTPDINIDLGVNNQSLIEIKIPDFRGLSNFNLGNKPNLETLDVTNALQLINIDISGCLNLSTLFLGMTNLPSIDVSQNINLINLGLDMYGDSSINLSQNINLETLYLGYPFTLNTLDLSNNTNLTSLTCTGTEQLTSLDLSQNINLQTLNCYQGYALESINIKNGSTITNLDFSECSLLNSICVDNEEMSTVVDLVNQYAYANCYVTNYCSLKPGGANFIVQGAVTFDMNNDGCDLGDPTYNNLQFNISNGMYSSTVFADNSGNYEIALYEGINTITPQLENLNYYGPSPTSITVDFPTDTSPYSQDFCVVRNGVLNDLEIVIIPLEEARPGFDANYKIVYKNKGTNVLSGAVDFYYGDNEEYTDFVSSSPVADVAINNTLTFNFTDIAPFETREVIVTMNLNTPTDPNFPLSGGETLSFNAVVNPVSGDETPLDNRHTITQLVVNSFDPNDKTCLEGNEIKIDEVGNYLHYMIRFENTGTAAAINIVVKDVIDVEKFDMATFIPVTASHDFVTRIEKNNEVEFIFENINLPFDDFNNDGYVIFKIRTLNTLVEGDTFSNQAEIYFDFNFPIITNDELTTVVGNKLSISDFYKVNAKIYPNPVHDILTIDYDSDFDSISIFNSNGQIVKQFKRIENTSKNSIDTNTLATGVYFIKLKTDAGEFVKKFIKN